jgi:serine/threonine protein kinase
VPETFGQYELHDVLGRGGMGVVYRAVDTVRDRTVALKVLPEHLASDELFKARFRRESRLAARLRDPHVIPIHDFGEINGRLFIDMRLVDGVDLKGLLARDGPLAPGGAARVLGQIGSALHSAHANGLVHRDVKPSNILLTDVREQADFDAFAYLVDFGIARSIEPGGTSLTTTGTAGTVAYMPPERIAGAPGNSRSDVYSLACVGFEMLAGRPPFEGEPFSVMYAHINTEPPRVSEAAENLPPALDDVLRKGMAKDVDQRFDTTVEFADAFSAAARTSLAPDNVTVPSRSATLNLGTSTRAGDQAATAVTRPRSGREEHPSGPFEAPAFAHRSRRPRRPLLAAITLLVLVLAAGVVVTIVNPWKDEPKPPRAVGAQTTRFATGATNPVKSWNHFASFSKLVGRFDGDSTGSFDGSSCTLGGPTNGDPDGVLDGVTCSDLAGGALQIIVDRFSTANKVRQYLYKEHTLARYSAVPVQIANHIVGAQYISPTDAREVNVATYFCGLPTYLVQFRVLSEDAAVRNNVQSTFWANSRFPDAIPPACNADFTGAAAGSTAIKGDARAKFPKVGESVPPGW